MTAFLNECRKAIAAGLTAGAVAFQSGQNLSVSVAVGVGAFALAWAVPNA